MKPSKGADKTSGKYFFPESRFDNRQRTQLHFGCRMYLSKCFKYGYEI